jgi:hypothetical protein
MMIRERLFRDAVSEVGPDFAKQRVARVARIIPRVILDTEATEEALRRFTAVLGAITREKNQRLKDGRGYLEPSELDVDRYSGSDTLGDLVRAYTERHAGEGAAAVVDLLRPTFAVWWTIDIPGEGERRRWLYVLHHLSPPDRMRTAIESARIEGGHVPRN